MQDEADGTAIAVAADQEIDAPHAGLRGKVFEGGALLMIRQIISMGLSLIGLLVITRMIGPAEYAPYVSALGICIYAQNLGQGGIAAFLVRSPGAPSRLLYDTATTMLLVSSVALVLAVEGGMSLITTWIPIPNLGPILSVLMISVLLQTLTIAPAAKLERTLDFRRVAFIEATTQLLYYATGVPLVFLGFGVWSLVIGYMAHQLYSCLAFHVAARYRPRLAWERRTVREILSYTMGYAAADWLWQLRGLVNPVIGGHFLAAQAVGEIGLAIRMLELLSFTKNVAYRLSVAVLAKVQHEPAKLVQAATDGMRLQTLALGPVLIGFSWFGGFLLSLVFGKRWEPVMVVYPFLALSYLTNAQFNIHSSILYVLRRNLDVFWFHAVYVALFAGAAWFLVHRFGLIGYGYAEAATLLSYPVIHYAVKRAVGSPNYRISAFWWAALAIGLFWRDLGWWDIAVPIVAILWPASVRQIRSYAAMARGRRRRAA